PSERSGIILPSALTMPTADGLFPSLKPRQRPPGELGYAARRTAPRRRGGDGTRGAGAPLPDGTRRHRGTVPPAGDGRLRRPVDARRQPGEVAPCPQHLVLRDVHPRRGCPRLSSF